MIPKTTMSQGLSLLCIPRAAASAGFAGLLIFGSSDRKDERAMIASERDLDPLDYDPIGALGRLSAPVRGRS